jgi:hypothetical protein
MEIIEVLQTGLVYYRQLSICQITALKKFENLLNLVNSTIEV